MSTTTVSAIIDSPTGALVVAARDDAIVRLAWAPHGAEAASDAIDCALLARAAVQLREYFAGARRTFDLPLAPPGSDFQKAVCTAILAIPFGETRTYGDLARALGIAAQPIGQACGGNPIPILIPCHRVVAADGKLGGFSSGRGVETKLTLLRLEGAILV